MCAVPAANPPRPNVAKKIAATTTATGTIHLLLSKHF